MVKKLKEIQHTLVFLNGYLLVFDHILKKVIIPSLRRTISSKQLSVIYVFL